MSTTSIIPLGNYDWYVLRTIGAKYFLLAESPLFRGYYSLKKGTFAESKLYSFLNNKFISKLESNGVDTEKISNLGILTSGQYQMYVKDKLPVSASPFLLQTQSEIDPDSVLAVNSSGDIYPIGIQVSCGIRPCMFVDKEYADAVTGIDPATISGVKLETESKSASEKSHESVSHPDQNEPDQVDNENDSKQMPDDTEKDKNENEIGKETGSVGLTDEIDTETKGENTESDNDTVSNDIDDSDNNNDVVSESVRVETVAPSVEEEKPYGDVETDTKTVKITTVGTKHAAYVFEDEYKEYAVLYEGGKEELEKILTEYGLTIRSFLKSSLVEDREPASVDKIQSMIREQQKRFRWRNGEK